MDSTLQWVALISSIIGIIGGISNVVRLIWGSQWFTRRRQLAQARAAHQSAAAASGAGNAAPQTTQATVQAPPVANSGIRGASDSGVRGGSQPGIIRTAGAQGGQFPYPNVAPQPAPGAFPPAASQPLPPLPTPSQPLPYTTAPSRPLPHLPPPVAQPAPRRKRRAHYPGLTRLTATGIISWYASFVALGIGGATYNAYPNASYVVPAIFDTLGSVGLLGALVSIIVAIVWSSVLAGEAKHPEWMWVTIVVSIFTIFGLGALIFAIWGPPPPQPVYAYSNALIPTPVQQRRP